MLNTPAPISERLDRRTDKSAGPDACWPWQGAHDANGYGTVYFDGRIRRAHVVALMLAVEPDPDRPFALHSCDNPPCVNPAHLRWGTRQDNVDDMIRRRRDRHPHGAEHGRAKLTESQVLEIRSREGKTLSEIAAEFGVSFGLIGHIRRGLAWKYLLTDSEQD